MFNKFSNSKDHKIPFSGYETMINVDMCQLDLKLLQKSSNCCDEKNKYFCICVLFLIDHINI